MTSPKHPKNFSHDEVCMWLVAIGLGELAPQFRSAAIDGGLLTDLDEENFKEVGCSDLQAKKIMRCLEISNQMATGGGNGANETRIQQLLAENAQLRSEIQRLTSGSQQTPKQSTPPAPAPQPPRGHPVVAGAAGGAARGAVMGAVGGAIMGDPGKGAKMGAAMGATGGAMGGLGARRRARMAGRY